MTLLVGNSSITGISTDWSYNPNHQWYIQFTAAQSGNATALYVYASGDGSVPFKLALWDSDGVLLAQTDVDDTAGWQSGSISSTAIVAGQTYYLGIAPDTASYPHLFSDGTTDAANADTNYGTWPNASAIEPGGDDVALANKVFRIYADGAGDTTAPVLSGATGAANGSRGATGGFNTDTGEGSRYSVLTTSATQPSVAQIKAGQNHAGAAAAYSTGGVTVTTAGAQPLNASSGLTPKTAYYWHSVHTDVANNDSNRISSAAFTTHGEITDTDGDNVVTNGQNSVTVNGFFGSSDPVVRIKSGSISQAQVDTAHTSTTITLSSITRGNLPYTDANHTHTIEVDTDE